MNLLAGSLHDGPGDIRARLLCMYRAAEKHEECDMIFDVSDFHDRLHSIARISPRPVARVSHGWLHRYPEHPGLKVRRIRPQRDWPDDWRAIISETSPAKDSH